MFKASLTIHKSLKGNLKVLACSEDADDAVEAFNACNDSGEIQLIIRGHVQKQKKIEGVEPVAKKPRRKKAE